MQRLCTILAVFYLLGGIAVWMQFSRTNPDGLANIGLIVYVLPVTVPGFLFGLLTGSQEFLLIPHRFGYWGDHAVFFFPSLLIVAAAIAWGPAKLVRMWRARRGILS